MECNPYDNDVETFPARAIEKPALTDAYPPHKRSANLAKVTNSPCCATHHNTQSDVGAKSILKPSQGLALQEHLLFYLSFAPFAPLRETNA